MSNDTEFLNELDEQMRRKTPEGGDTHIDLPASSSDNLPSTDDDSLQEQYDNRVPEDRVDTLLIQTNTDSAERQDPTEKPSQTGAAMEVQLSPQDEVKAPEGPEETGVVSEEFITPKQGELNRLVQQVTEIGADDEILGKDGLLESIRNGEQSEAHGGSYIEGFVSTPGRLMPNLKI